LLAASSTEGC